MDGFSKKLRHTGCRNYVSDDLLGGGIHITVLFTNPPVELCLVQFLWNRKNPLSHQSLKNVSAGDRQSNAIYSTIYQAAGHSMALSGTISAEWKNVHWL